MKISSFVFGLILFLGAVPSFASEGIFGYLYTAETTPGGNWEYEQRQTLRNGKARGDYTALDLTNEFEYGITDFFQGALYINSSYLDAKNQYDPENVSSDLKDRNDFNFNGMSIELLYRVLSPYKDGIGLAFYLEPELEIRDRMTGDDAISRELEGRIIVQKNFFNDDLITALNIMIEPEWEKGPDDGTNKELWMEYTLGASYHFAPNWYAGLEFRNHEEFVDMKFDNQEHSAYFFGPNIHYGSEKYWWTLTALPQIAGWPRTLGVGSDGKAVESSYAHLGQHEKFEVRFAFGIPLGGEHEHVH